MDNTPTPAPGANRSGFLPIPSFSLTMLTSGDTLRAFTITEDTLMPRVKPGQTVIAKQLDSYRDLPAGAACIVVALDENIIARYGFVDARYDTLELKASGDVPMVSFAIIGSWVKEAWQILCVIPEQQPEITLDEHKQPQHDWIRASQPPCDSRTVKACNINGDEVNAWYHFEIRQWKLEGFADPDDFGRVVMWRELAQK